MIKLLSATDEYGNETTDAQTLTTLWNLVSFCSIENTTTRNLLHTQLSRHFAENNGLNPRKCYISNGTIFIKNKRNYVACNYIKTYLFNIELTSK